MVNTLVPNGFLYNEIDRTQMYGHSLNMVHFCWPRSV